MGKKRLGDILVERGTLGQADIDRALVLQREKNARLGEILMQNLHVSKTEIGTALQQIQDVPYVECPPRSIAPEAIALLPRAIAVKCCALPLEVQGSTLIVAVAEPQDLRVLEELRFSSGRSVSPRFSFREDIQAGIRQFYDKEDLAKSLVLKNIDLVTNEEALEASPEEEEALTQLEFIVAGSREENKEALRELRAGAKKRSYAARLLSIILTRAAQREASDLHLEPRVDSTIVRMRVDGLFQDLLNIPRAQQAAVAQRIKNLADMDTGAHRLPQEGRFLIIHKGRRLDVRVSTLPTYFGEKILLRILDPRSTLRTFEQLGMSREHEAAMKRILNSTQGMLLVTGPTGAGKSTTLYSALNAMASPSRSIVAVEDPVEYMLDGVTQVQVSPSSGLTVAATLQPILRQNPNVIMIGEILDEETASIALRAAHIGHLVLTTLRAKDSMDAITHLRGLGLSPNLLSSISGIVGQRLLRTLCTCRTETEATSDYRRGLELIGLKEPLSRMYVPAGCPLCDNTGYRGRIAVFELLLMDDAIRDAIRSDVSTDEIRQMLPGMGFRDMRQDALDKVLHGQTTIDEVLRVFPSADPAPPLQLTASG
jgi:type IV pilus assembly protein PilB